MENEIYKDVIGYNGLYQVSNMGNVKRMKKTKNQHPVGMVLKPYVTRTGYTRVQLFIDGDKRNHFIHRLVAEVFIENPMKKTQVNHIDGVKSNNTMMNLEWSTPSENGKHSFQVLGRIPTRKIDVNEVESIRKRYADGMKLTKLSKEYDVSQATIWNICTGRTYLNYPGPIVLKGQKGSGNGSTVLTESHVLKIRELWNQYSKMDKPKGWATYKVSEEMGGINAHIIRHIVARRTWNHI